MMLVLGATYAHAESTAEVVENYKGTWVARVIHCAGLRSTRSRRRRRVGSEGDGRLGAARGYGALSSDLDLVELNFIVGLFDKKQQHWSDTGIPRDRGWVWWW